MRQEKQGKRVIYNVIKTVFLYRLFSDKGIKFFDLCFPERFFGSFKYQRNIVEPCIIHQYRENLFSKKTLSDIFMPVDPCSQILFGIIEMHRLKVFKTNNFTEFFKSLFKSIR